MVDPRALGNEPASPVAGATETVQVNPSQQEGLTKREYFAGLAMAAILSRDEARPRDATAAAHDEFLAIGARYAVRHADALLAELARGAA